jgi:PKD repeat protein
VGLDFFDNLTLAYEVDGEVFVETRGSIFEKTPLGSGLDPHLAFDPLGTHVAYAAAPGGGGARKIHMRSRTGPRWSPSFQLTVGDGEDRAPQLVLARDRSPVIAWERTRGEGSVRIWFLREGQPAVDVGRGTAPALLLDQAGRASIFFLRDGDIFRAREESADQPSVFPPARNITETPFLDESPPRIAIHEQRIYLAYEREGTVYLASDRAGDFRDAKTVVQGGAASPSLSISPNGAAAFAFLRGGDVEIVLGTTFFFPEPVQITSTTQTESSPRIAIDSFANLFVGFHQENGLFYTTDAGPPQARFEALPPKGEAPLLVHFDDQSTGDVTSWRWDFGDGSTSTEREPDHLYEETGEYVASLIVSGPGGQSPIMERKTILVQSPGNQLRVGDVSVFPGQQGVHVPILATHVDPAQGLTVVAAYDPDLIEVVSVDRSVSELSGLHPELFAVQISDDPDEAFVTIGVLIDVQSPFDGRTLPPGKDQRVLNIVVNVKPEAPPGSITRLELRNQTGRPPLNNIFTVNGFSVLPTLGEEGSISIERLTFPPPRFFIRGDADATGVLDLTDAVITLNFLFGGIEAVACEDGADVTDDGEINVTDPIVALNYLFRAGPPPPPPFPEAGLDPTDDGLETCMLR